jgi:predicted transcriptional regulator
MSDYEKISAIELFRHKNNLSKKQTSVITGYSLRSIERIEFGESWVPSPMSKLLDIYNILKKADSALKDISKFENNIKNYKKVDSIEIIKLCFNRIELVFNTKYANKKRCKKCTL